MPVLPATYQEVFHRVWTVTRPCHWHRPLVRRLALLILGVLAAPRGTQAAMAAELVALGVTRSRHAASVQRSLRRVLNDTRLTIEHGYLPLLQEVVDWERLRRSGQPVRLIVDESSQDKRVHLLRVGLAYWGTTVPMAWALWPQNQPLEPGAYWTHVETVLDLVARVLPADLPVQVLADRAYDIPGFIDRLTARGWHWVIRVKADSALRWCDQRGREQSLQAVVHKRVQVPRQRWKGRGRLFKKAGWREASVVAVWEPGQLERLVVVTDAPPTWRAVTEYDARFWCEPGFRNDKSQGWRWEDNQVQGTDHQERLLLAMAWATVLALCAGYQVARARLATVARRRRTTTPQPARESLFTLGRRWLRQGLYRALEGRVCWRLPEVESVSWYDRWKRAQEQRYLPQTVRP